MQAPEGRAEVRLWWVGGLVLAKAGDSGWVRRGVWQRVVSLHGHALALGSAVGTASQQAAAHQRLDHVAARAQREMCL